jgi:hypothetical protein
MVLGDDPAGVVVGIGGEQDVFPETLLAFLRLVGFGDGQLD